MSNHIYKIIEVVGSSPQSQDQAIRNAIAKANESLKHMDWFEVIQSRGHIENGEIAHYQVMLKIGFRLAD